MLKDLVSNFGKKAAVAVTALTALSPMFGAEVDRLISADQIDSAPKWKAGMQSAEQIVIHVNDEYLVAALAMHNILEEEGYPTQVFSGRKNLERPFEAFVYKKSIGEFTVDQAPSLPNMAANRFDGGNKIALASTPDVPKNG